MKQYWAYTFGIWTALMLPSVTAQAQLPLRYDIHVPKGNFDGYDLSGPTSIPIVCDQNGVARKVLLCGTDILQIGFRVAATLPSVNDVYVNVRDEFKLDKEGANLLRRVPSLATLRWCAPDELMAASDWTQLAVATHLRHLRLVANNFPIATSGAQFPVATLRAVASHKAIFANIEVELIYVGHRDPALDARVEAVVEETKKAFGSGRVQVVDDPHDYSKVVILPDPGAPAPGAMISKPATVH